MKRKILLILMSFVILFYIGHSLMRETYSIDENIFFSYDLNVDKENNIIKYLSAGMKVSELLEKISSNVDSNKFEVITIDNNVKEYDDLIFSGDRLLLKDSSNNVISEYKLSILGDVTGNGIVNSTDATRLFEYYRDKRELDSEYISSGNVKFKDGNVISTEDKVVLTTGDKLNVDYVVFPDDDGEIKLSDIAKLYQYSQNKVNLDYYSSKSSVEIEWSSSDKEEVKNVFEIVTTKDLNGNDVVSNGLITANWGGQATLVAKNGSQKEKTVVIVKNPNLIQDEHFLVTDGTNIIRNNDKKIIQLKGYNLGVWLSRSFAFMPVRAIPECRINGCNKESTSSSCDISKCTNEQMNEENFLSCINNEAFYQVLNQNVNDFSKIDGFDSSNDVVDSLSDVLYDNYITNEDYDMISQSGANVVRLVFEYDLFLTKDSKGNYYYDDVKAEKTFNRFDSIIDECKKRGIYVIIDFHLAPGRQNRGGYCLEYTFLKNEGKNDRQVVVEMWGKIAERYYDESVVAGYDLLNEPDSFGNENVIFDFYNDAYKAIRNAENTADKEDKYPEHIVIMEEDCVYCGYDGSSSIGTYSIGNLPKPSDKGWTNVVYSTHNYFFNGNVESSITVKELKSRNVQKLNNIIKKSNDYNVPYYVGEFSQLEYDKVDEDGTGNAWADALNRYNGAGISYTVWTYKGNWDDYYGLVYYGTRNNLYINKNDIDVSINEGLITKEKIDSLDSNNLDEDKYYPMRDTNTGMLGTLNEKQLYNVYNKISNSAGGNVHKVDLETDSYDVIKEVFSYSSSESMKFNSNLYKVFLKYQSITNKRIVEDVKLYPVGDMESKSLDYKCELDLKVGDVISLNYKVIPTTTINKDVKWSSDNSIVKIDPITGSVTALSIGETIITASVKPYELDDSYIKTGVCTIKVS